tara:strand:- start:1628 stop:1912 length:285 start_codon:yes stop_codon:yes gene_type:complete
MIYNIIYIMDINQLIEIVKKKIYEKLKCEEIIIEDKTFLHKSHAQFDKNKFHIKLILRSEKLKELNKIQSTKLIYKILDVELKKYIHSIQISII